MAELRLGRVHRDTLAGKLGGVSVAQPMGMDSLLDAILCRLPPGPALYPLEDLATAPVRFFVAERIREVCFEELDEELPYSLAVGIEEYRESSDPVYIAATIYIERESQKGIVIGKGGRTVRRIGVRSRQDQYSPTVKGRPGIPVSRSQRRRD